MATSPSSSPLAPAAAEHTGPTGPRTTEGKARSSQNAFKNGLASGRILIPGERRQDFDALVSALMAEHQPATTTEAILVEAMARHHWLEQRAQRLQAETFEMAADSFSGPLPELVSKDLAVLIRYETTHHRAFHKSLATLLKIKKERAGAAPIEFVSQKPVSPEPAAPEFVSQNENPLSYEEAKAIYDRELDRLLAGLAAYDASTPEPSLKVRAAMTKRFLLSMQEQGVTQAIEAKEAA